MKAGRFFGLCLVGFYHVNWDSFYDTNMQSNALLLDKGGIDSGFYQYSEALMTVEIAARLFALL